MMNWKDLEGRSVSQSRSVLGLSRGQNNTKKICGNYARFSGLKSKSISSKSRLCRYTKWVLFVIYRVIKKSLCTWWLQNTSFLLHYLAQSDCLAAGHQGKGDTRLTLSPSVIPNSNYVIVVSDWNCLKYFCVCFLYCNHQANRNFLITLYNSS
jgi:hypothetical protein